MGEFQGETYSYDDARRRAPGAWRLQVIQGDGWSREEFGRVAPPGLGTFARRGKTWIYILPDGYAEPVLEHYGLPDPPPLPRPAGERERCHCGKPHRCTACGEVAWIELHGVADGYCTHCYHRG